MKSGQFVAIEALKVDNRLFVDADDIAPVLESNPQDIRDTARRDITQLGFPAIRIGARLKIPREPFLRYIGEDV